MNSWNVTELTSCDKTSKIVPEIPENRLLTMSRQYTQKIVGEQEKIQLLICAVVSRNLPEDCRFSVLVLNRYASGKSHTINTVLEPIDNTGDVLHFTAFTEAYLKRSPDFQNVTGKVIKIEQLERKDDNGQIFISNLKHLITEGRLNFGVVDKADKEKHTARELTVTGKPVILTTSTNPNINPEDESRFIVIELDESDAQTKRILEHQARQSCKINSKSEWESAKSELEKHYDDLKQKARHIDQIVIPFADKIVQKLPVALTMRRDYPKIEKLTKVIAFLNYRNRYTLVNNTPQHLPTDAFGKFEDFYTGVLIASVEDFRKALEIAGKSIAQTINNTTEKSMAILEALKKSASEKLDGVTLDILTKEIGIPTNTIRDYLVILERSGFVTRDTSERAHRWIPTEKKHLALDIDLEFTESDLQAWIKENNPNDVYTVVSPRDNQNQEELGTNQPKTTHETESVSIHEVVT